MFAHDVFSVSTDRRSAFRTKPELLRSVPFMISGQPSPVTSGFRDAGPPTPAELAAGLSLARAVAHWCDGGLRVVHLMTGLAAKEAAAVRYRKRLFQPAGAQDDAGDASTCDDQRHFEEAERKLLDDFRRRIERGEVALRGFQTRPAPLTTTTLIPGCWATDFVFDLKVDAIDFHDQRYVGVRAFDGAAQDTSSDGSGVGAAAAGPFQLDRLGRYVIEPQHVASLSDETVLTLLEDHARRVVEEEAGPLLLPSKISFAPILLRQMRWRAGRGEGVRPLQAECVALVAWLRSKVPSHQTPTPKSMTDAMRSEYRRLHPEMK
jgi:hypothetical protein